MSKVVDLLGDKTGYHLDHTCKTTDKSLIYIPSPDTIDKVWIDSSRNIRALNSLQTLLGYGHLANTGYASILPVDRDVGHTTDASFAPNPIYFDPESTVKLAIEGGCNVAAPTLGVLRSVARKYAHKIPFVAKSNHNELLTYPNTYDQVLFGMVKRAWSTGVVAVGTTTYFSSEQSCRQLVETAKAFEHTHELGMTIILWCCLRNGGFKEGATGYHAAADLTGQADRLGVIIKTDVVKQRLPTNNGGFKAVGSGKTDERTYAELTSKYPVDLYCYQVTNSYMGCVGLINSGGESYEAPDLHDAVITAVVNERAGDAGLISGHKAFQEPMNKGVELLNAIQDVYLDPIVTIARSRKDRK